MDLCDTILVIRTIQRLNTSFCNFKKEERIYITAKYWQPCLEDVDIDNCMNAVKKYFSKNKDIPSMLKIRELAINERGLQNG